jgi:DNA-binding transcriptional MerR regulator
MEPGSEVLEEVEDDLEIESAVESEDQEKNAEEGNNAEEETVQIAESLLEVEQDIVPEVPHVQEEALLQEEPIVSEQVIEKDADMAADESQPEVETSEKGLNIPEDNALYSRQYYTMRETAAMFNVNQSLLRFWENEFDILKPKKNRKGDRYFRPEDIKNLELIYHLLRVRKFTIEGAKDYLKSKAKSMQTFEMVQRLEKLKHFLLDIKTAI